MLGLLYTVGVDGDLQRMRPSAPENEDKMQALVARLFPVSTNGTDLML